MDLSINVRVGWDRSIKSDRRKGTSIEVRVGKGQSVKGQNSSIKGESTTELVC